MADSPNAVRAPQMPEEPKASLVSNILAIVGFIILIVVVIWGLVHLANISRAWFSSFFGWNDAAIEVTAPKSVTSGLPFDVSWKYDEPVEGTYAFLYQCQGNLQLQTPSPIGTLNSVPCGAAFTISGASKEVSITPLLAGSESLSVPLSIIFMPSGTGTQAQGSATVTVTPTTQMTAPVPTPSPTPIVVEETPAPAPTPAPSPTPTPTPVATSPADLSVRIVAVSIDGAGSGVATFDIENVGGTSSGAYYFTATLPTQTGYTYNSPAQTSLAPGSHIVSTLRFSGGVSGIFSVSITTPDANGTNNYASRSVNAPYYNPYDYNPYPNSTYYPLQNSYSYQMYYPQYQPYSYPSYSQYSPYSTYYPYAY